MTPLSITELDQRSIELGDRTQYVATLSTAERNRLEHAIRAAYLDGEPDGTRSYAALAWAVKGVAP